MFMLSWRGRDQVCPGIKAALLLRLSAIPKAPAPPSPLCEGAFFFRVKVRYLVGKVLTGIESLSQLW
jgi:hypothetical protein